METLTVLVGAGPDVDGVAAAYGGTREHDRVLVFHSAREAIRCAVALQRADPLLQLGIHTGELERTDGELSGRAVAKTARIAARARPGEVLASGVVRELA